MRRTETCEGKRLVKIRTEQGLTQNSLAKKADCSERLIRKAESGETITYSAIKNIAAALSQNGQIVHPEDLISNPTQLAKQFLQAFKTYESEMVAQVEHFIDENFVLYCAGDSEKIPFAGVWKGTKGLDQWVKCFFKTLMRPQKDFYQPDYLTYKNTVVAWGQDWAHAPNLTFPPIWVTQKFVFKKGKLVRFEDLFDTDSRSKHLAQARVQSLLDD